MDYKAVYCGSMNATDVTTQEFRGTGDSGALGIARALAPADAFLVRLESDGQILWSESKGWTMPRRV